MLLNECCQKRQWLLEVMASSAPGSAGAPFGARINVLTQQKHTVCTGHGSGPNKKDAKHNAAAACLDQLLGMEQLAASDLISAMTCPVTIAAAVQGGASGAAQQEGAGLTGGFPADPVNSAASLTHNVLKLGSYHRCAEVMRHVHSTEQGRTKTFLMVLNEYGVKYGLMASYELGRSASGNFYYRGTLIDAMGDVVAKEVGNKQEAKQAAAAALIDYMVAMYNIPVERFRSGKSVGK
ncbi:hypothetical protein Vretimale_12201 [Volvox reticuliferus]|uniref:DRBM domain-containing protein n=1 Tax=Volvox reticuliferus TaxID=1737510 RepID=A0A8J4GIW7_9CHLO|nr:hypothetical protein Vretifemale_19726 [Volvox reticuliferus]GIM08103.1 hypothetical protein Vretimale_12201 [Volvox reticuliferus]